jgi:iron complex outermembrane recepter protein
VRSADLGIRYSWDQRYQVTLAGYYTHLSDDVAFSAEEGRLERIGATRRLGTTLYAEARPLEGLLGALSVTYVDAELLQPPPATAEEPTPPFKAGQNLPSVPPLVIRLDLGAQHRLSEIAEYQLVGNLGLGFSYLSKRPLAYGAFSSPVPLLDATCGFKLGAISLSFDVYNALGLRYAATELNFASNWDPDAVRSRTPVRHTVAGAPRTFSASLGVSL